MEMKWKIGSVEMENPFILAPMAGVTDLPFRMLCKEQGAGLLCTEMVSAKAISFHNKNTISLMQIDSSEHPVSMQIFGSEPDLMAEVAKSIEEQPFDILDINMGCPVPKVVNNGEGSALLKNPELIREIVTQVSHAVKKPVTAKIRIGFEGYPVDPVEIAKIIEDSGAAAVAVHGRTRQQYYAGEADWDTIRRIKEAVSIPVIGNGDVDSPKKAEKLVRETGCDGVMIGRAVRGNPWIFREMNHYFTTGELLPRPSWEEIKEEDKDKFLIEIDPGVSFGTGKHETTQLCIRQLRKYMKDSAKVLDVGCGSGILSIVALKLGAGEVVGTDIDKDCIMSANENLKVNHLENAKTEFYVGNLIDDTQLQQTVGNECYDIVVANILADVIIPMAPVIPARLKKGGIFITSGIIDFKEQEVKEALEKAGFEILETNYQGEWVNITAKKC